MERFPGLRVFKEFEQRDYLNMDEAFAQEARWRAEKSPKLSLQELKEAVSMGLDLADYDARLQAARAAKLEAEKAAKLEEEGS